MIHRNMYEQQPGFTLYFCTNELQILRKINVHVVWIMEVFECFET